MNSNEKNSAPSNKHQPREVEFFVVEADVGCGTPLSFNGTGTLIDLDVVSIGLLTEVPLQPGNIVKFDHGGTTKTGVVMWSVESSDNFRVQVRFI